MNNYILTASRDGIGIDFETVITAATAPGFWECYDIAAAHGCAFFTVEEIPAGAVVYDRTTAERLRELVDVLTPQETADAVGRPVVDGGTVYHPTAEEVPPV